MAFKIGLRPEEKESLCTILVDIITSAAFFKEKNVEIHQERDGLEFMFMGHCPNEYLTYLSWKYDLSLECV